MSLGIGVLCTSFGKAVNSMGDAITIVEAVINQTSKEKQIQKPVGSSNKIDTSFLYIIHCVSVSMSSAYIGDAKVINTHGESELNR